MRAIVFDIFTADTFVAGIATKILDGESIRHHERIVVLRSPLVTVAEALAALGTARTEQGDVRTRTSQQPIETDGCICAKL